MDDAGRHAPFITPQNQRRWSDLQMGRLAVGLVAAPLPPIVLGCLLLWLVDSGDPFTDDGTFIPAGERFFNVLRVGAIVEAAAGPWSIIAGLAALVLRSRRSGLVGRVDCFLLGILLAFSIPVVCWLCSLAVDAVVVQWGSGLPYFNFGHLGTDGLGIAALVGLPLTPFGFLGGWIFWRLVIRPAVAPVPDVSGMFE
jgi:hypothetical protein